MGRLITAYDGVEEKIEKEVILTLVLT